MDSNLINDVQFTTYEKFDEIAAFMPMVDQELSEPYSIYTYRYFLSKWPQLCIYAKQNNTIIGVIIGKLELHQKSRRNRGYIAIVVVQKEFRKQKLGKKLVQLFIDKIKELGGDEIVLETEITNTGALRLYESMGFVRVKRMQNYYMSGNDAIRLKLWFVNPEDLLKQNKENDEEKKQEN